MLPSLTNLDKIPKHYLDFLSRLRSSGFEGDIDDTHASRLLVSTDNSVYQCMPYAVIFPKGVKDVQTAMRLGHEMSGEGDERIIFTARGGGTGTNGQSLNVGVIIDMSRHMKGVTDFSPERKEVTVQTGVIKDELNEMLAPHKLFFSPELSTSNRATVGGMISNDAAGQGSLVYGRTSDHVKAVKAVLADGSLCLFRPVKGDDLMTSDGVFDCGGDAPQSNGAQSFSGIGIARRIYPRLKENAQRIGEVFPKLNRFLTGYDLHHAYDAKTDTLNMARLICGAEGTLGVAVEVTLDLTSMPAFRTLLVIKYESFISALRHANHLISAGALSVETVDSTVLGLARKDTLLWSSVSEHIQEVPGKVIDGINIVEFASSDPDKEKAKLMKLYEEVQKQAETFEDGILGSQIVDTKEGIAVVYNMRKKSVGYLGSMASDKKLVPFVEDTAVPPANLCDYIMEFRQLLDGLGVIYGMFGHVDTGVMHVRPALDLTLDADKEKFFKISDGVANLVRKYDGQMWGEHGRGYRAKYAELYFKELYPIVREIKELFDPHNRLNPHKICMPLSEDREQVVQVNSPMRGDLDRQIPLSIRQNFEGAIACNGNGQCFTYQASSLMCPSYRYTKDHVRSPKGYSELMRDWLRILYAHGGDARALEDECDSRGVPLMSFFARAYNTLYDRDDYNHEYMKKIRTCVACKSCKTQCPSHVNVADLNSRFLSLYYTRYLRPASDFLTLGAERMLPLLSGMPGLSNLVLGSSINRLALRKIFGFDHLPAFERRPFAAACREQGFEELDLHRVLYGQADTVIVNEAFTRSYDSLGLISLARVLRRLGRKVVFLRPYVNGKVNVIRGDRRGFIRHAHQQAVRMELLSSRGKTLVGFDPALTICYRDEYGSILKDKRGTFEVLMPQEILARLLDGEKAGEFIDAHKAQLQKAGQGDFYREPFYLMCHCTENALTENPGKAWAGILRAFGLEARPVALSCCGMAGLFGHMADNQDESTKTYRMAWKPSIDRYGISRCLVTGFSCRQQVARMEGERPRHPVDLIDMFLGEALGKE